MTDYRPIGMILEELGFVTKDQIAIALDVQKANPSFLGEILQDLDIVTSSEISEAIAFQNKLEYLNLDDIIPSPDVLKIISQDIAVARNILPISIDEKHIVVATQDVNDLVTQDYIKKISNREVKFVVGDKKAIARHVQIHYNELINPIRAEIRSAVKQTVDGVEINLPNLVNLLINNAIKDNVTDIHITPEHSVTNVFFRIDGVLSHYYSLPFKLHAQICARLKILSDLNISEQRVPQDGAFSYNFLNEGFDIRISTLPTNHGENIVMRVLGKNSSLFSLTSLGLSEQNSKKVEKIVNKPYGIILVVGPTGSGKTTTLYSALRKVDSLKKNIMTIEDPIEYKFSFIKQTQLNEKAGYTFNAAIRAFMRQDPDVMLVGEIRDSQTAELAIRASITGHLVLSTLHTNDAIGTIPRLEDLGVPPYLIGSGLLAVLAQRLVRKLCKTCKEPFDVTDEELKELGVSERILDLHKERELYKAVGCPVCKNSGYIGRQAIIEILEIDEEIESMIAAKATSLEILKLAHKKGMLSMKEDGYIKVLTGITTFSEIDRVIN
ncbi:GspE/PulE family protein [Candidatus Sulfurimonas baltica]|uniref:Flp pilus assembly complex ATPase component TadA n=1 Tax=Candidatus Sulfurimonas baltica TaxID=2740404 RepID=A0A7S7LX56_9BACT|nr:GspE/PulE family protein [Candidatus Sulfurimonas baltica]QOY53057.1 Flp pilus assembly complex ATPase component TadA [Candidatus Sulfurimonas baltica]